MILSYIIEAFSMNDEQRLLYEKQKEQEKIALSNYAAMYISNVAI